MDGNVTNVNYEEIAKRLKELRESRNMTQAEIGEIAKVSNKAVWAWENGKSIPRMGSLQRIADYFNVSASWLIEGESETLNALINQIEGNVVNVGATKETTILIERIQKLDADKKNLLMHYLDALEQLGKKED